MAAEEFSGVWRDDTSSRHAAIAGCRLSKRPRQLEKVSSLRIYKMQSKRERPHCIRDGNGLEVHRITGWDRTADSWQPAPMERYLIVVSKCSTSTYACIEF